MSSNDCSRAASMSRTASPRVPITSAISALPRLNMSSNERSRPASTSSAASPRLPIASTNDSALSRNWSATRWPRCTMLSVMRAPVCSRLDTTSPPRRLRSSTRESPVFLSVVLTSSTRLEMVSASWLPVSITSSDSSCERLVIRSRMASDFCANPSVTCSSRSDIACCRLAEISVNSSPM